MRGILTRSLQDAGVPFEDAYKLASEIRQELVDTPTVTTRDLRASVLEYLRKDHSSAVVHRYESPPGPSATLLVRDLEGRTTPFSRGQHRSTLVSCGLPVDAAAEITARINEHLLQRGSREITSKYLGNLTYRYLHRSLGPAVAHRYLVWNDFLHSDRPLLLLIGGTAGTGKSTLATRLASRLTGMRIQSTDMLREVMRMMIPERLLPVLHTSSFNAWQALPVQPDAHTDEDALLIEGYRSQAELLSVPCEGVVQRALKERVSLILEGVHVQPSFLEKIPKDTDALVVAVVLAILDPEQLGKQIRVRGRNVPDRRSERYLEHSKKIWRLQEFLVTEADRLHVPVIPNDDEEKAVQQIMHIIIQALARDFSGSPREVFV